MNAAVEVGTSAVAVAAANPQRVSALVVNNGTVPIYVGYSSSVTTSDGIPVAVGQGFEEREFVGALYAISGTAAQDVRVGETG